MADHHSLTRDIYQKQHQRIADNKEASDRIFGMYDSATFGIPKDWFRGKEVLDAGCGNIGALLVRLFQLGASNSISNL